MNSKSGFGRLHTPQAVAQGCVCVGFLFVETWMDPHVSSLAFLDGDDPSTSCAQHDVRRGYAEKGHCTPRLNCLSSVSERECVLLCCVDV